MGLLSEILLLPIAPLRATTWIAEQVEEQAERERSAPIDVDAELAELDRQREAGLLSADEAEIREEELLRGLLEAAERGPLRDG